MLFNSLEFLYFFAFFFVLYWLLKKHLSIQNTLLLIGSYIFYGWWDYRFLGLIAFSTLVDYLTGWQIAQSKNPIKRKLYLFISLGVNLGLLMTFKYLGFFVDSFISLLQSLGIEQDPVTLGIILPVGISFYTFQTMSYTLDIYKGRLEPTKNLLSFATFVAFFPQLVAGPIERASNLLPQILKKRSFNYHNSVEGIRIILYGLFKKVAIADTVAPFVNDIFANYETMGSGVLILGAVLFAFQIYGDFSGYSDIARGLAYLLGFELMINFREPYFSRNIGEFWKRWHISLSTWFRDYVYIPLGGSRGSKYLALKNIFIVFLVSGFWHGANWTFIAWGSIHGMMYLPIFFARKYASSEAEKKPSIPKVFFQTLATFSFVTLAWIFFRADNIEIAWHYLQRIFTDGSFGVSSILKTLTHLISFIKCAAAIGILLVFDRLIYRGFRIRTLWFLIFILIGLILFGSYRNAIEFIYFQF